jgi:hypothetical protein
VLWWYLTTTDMHFVITPLLMHLQTFDTLLLMLITVVVLWYWWCTCILCCWWHYWYFWLVLSPTWYLLSVTLMSVCWYLVTTSDVGIDDVRYCCFHCTRLRWYVVVVTLYSMLCTVTVNQYCDMLLWLCCQWYCVSVISHLMCIRVWYYIACGYIVDTFAVLVICILPVPLLFY